MPKRPGAFVIIVLALAASACGGGGEGEYSPGVERNFTEECVAGVIEAGKGALGEAETTEYCSCTYDEIEANVSFAEFAEYESQLREDEDTPPPPKFEAAAASCRADQGYSEGVENSFIAECVGASVAGADGLSEAQAREYCGCAFAEIEAQIPFEEFAEYDAKVRKDPSAEPPPKMAAAVERCAASVG